MLSLIDHIDVVSGPHGGDEWRSLPKEPAIYMLVNEMNGKLYVGRSVNVRSRIRSHYRNDYERYNGAKLSSAKKKHGLDSFKFYIVEWCDRNTVLEREEHYLKTISPFGERGYNIRDVADSTTGSFEMSDDQKKVISESLKEYHKNHENAFKGKTHSEESRELIKKNLRDENGVLKSAKTMQSEEYREKKRQDALDRDVVSTLRSWVEDNGAPHTTPVIMVDCATGEHLMEFKTVKEAASHFGKSRGTNISNCLKGRSKKAYGYFWVKKETEDKEI